MILLADVLVKPGEPCFDLTTGTVLSVHVLWSNVPTGCVSLHRLLCAGDRRGRLPHPGPCRDRHRAHRSVLQAPEQPSPEEDGGRAAAKSVNDVCVWCVCVWDAG